MATVLTNVGEQYICDYLSATDTAAADYVGWGTGTTAAAKGDTGLETASAEARVQGTKSTSGSGSSAKYQVVAEITSASSQTISEACLFNASTGGDCVIRSVFTGIALANGDKIEFTFTLDPS